MVKRDWWIRKIHKLWAKKSLIWLSGVRRVGKTSLCQSLDGVAYFDCELPSVRRELSDPESFLSRHRDAVLVLDEVHRLENPSELLKLATDHFSKTRVIATGSSTLGASAKFRDTLTGRKAELWLTPLLSIELEDFGGELPRRLLRGGLPPFFLDEEMNEIDFQEWLDSFWAKDVQELFRVERRHSFMKFTELILAQSGGMFEATRFAKLCEVSRPTITNYLSVLESTFLAHVIRPFSTHKQTEIVSAPKVYGFDTGFVCQAKGWSSLRSEDYGLLWEHYVLNELQGRLQNRKIHYWRNKNHREIDFVWEQPGAPPVVIECKWSAELFEAKNLVAFRALYPEGRNYVVAHDVPRPFTKRHTGHEVRYVGLEDLVRELGGIEKRGSGPEG